MKSVFFSPVFNQIHEFPTVLKELKEIQLPCDEILLVNNGSNDGSEKLVKDSGYPYIDLPKNLGIGYSMMKAVEWAKLHDFDVLGVIASNGKMLPNEMHRLINPIKEGKADYVKGSRYMDGGASPNLPGFRKYAIPMVNHFVKLMTGTRTTDSTCGYRAYKIEMFDRATFNWQAPSLNTYSFEYYIDAKAMMDDTIEYLEVPVTMRYPKSGRYTKMKGIKPWWEMLRPWMNARFDGQGFIVGQS